MAESVDGATRFDPQAVQAKYLAERDRRLVPGRADIRDLTGDERFARYRDDPFADVAPREPVADDVHTTIIGGGIAGLVAGAKLRDRGVDSIRIVDQAGGVGGTWYWNRYPGVMCDVESYQYMPLLEEMDYIPTRRYASGAEILAHLERIAARYDLTDDALFHTGVTRSEWDEGIARWRITTDRGDRFTSRYLVLAVGILNLLKLPAIAGMEDFAGHSFHTARWDYDYTGGDPGVDYTGPGPHDKLDKLGDKVVALVGTGATGIQIVPALAESAQHLYLFQRTPSAIGVRGNRPTPPEFAADLRPGWQKDRMDNFQSIMLGRDTDEDLTDDGWTNHYARVHHPPRWKGMTLEDYMTSAETLDYGVMEEHRQRVAEQVTDPATAEMVKPYYRYLCKRPCFHDEYLPALNEANVTVVDCPAGWDGVTAAGPVVDGEQYEVDCIIYATGFEAEVTPLYRRAGHDLIGRHGVSLAERWVDGPRTLFGMMIGGFPNLFAMPAPAQQSVVTVNYTQLAVLGAEFVADTIASLDERGAIFFDVEASAEDDWTQKIVDGYVDGSAVMSACTPSRINQEGDPKSLRPESGNFGRGFGDYFGFRDLLAAWRDAGCSDGLDVVVPAERA